MAFWLLLLWEHIKQDFEAHWLVQLKQLDDHPKRALNVNIISLTSEFLFRSRVDCVRRKLDFGQVMKKPQETNADRYQVGKSEPSFSRRRLDFGETEQSVLLRHPGKWTFAIICTRCKPIKIFFRSLTHWLRSVHLKETKTYEQVLIAFWSAL